MLIENLPQSTSKLTVEDQYTACCVLNTAEYCLETTRQLEEKLKVKVSPDSADKVEISISCHELRYPRLDTTLDNCLCFCQLPIGTHSRDGWFNKG